MTTRSHEPAVAPDGHAVASSQVGGQSRTDGLPSRPRRSAEADRDGTSGHLAQLVVDRAEAVEPAADEPDEEARAADRVRAEEVRLAADARPPRTHGRAEDDPRRSAAYMSAGSSEQA